jgi:hypothetical protein
MEQKTYVLNSVAASAADITLAGGILTFTGNDAGLKVAIDYLALDRPVIARVAPVAETLQISTFTYTFAVNKVFSFNIMQRVDDENLQATISVDSTNPGLSTDALVQAAFIKKATAFGFKITPTSAAGVITLTAQAGYPKFKIVAISNGVAATSTAGVNAVGDFADVVAQGGTPTVGNTYSKYEFVTRHLGGEMFGKQASADTRKDIWFINNGDGDAAALYTRVNNYIAGLDNAGAVANPEGFSGN